ncbi:caspase b-like [Phymastichus coffea]|uniref:caspase b-like n=1 Tax=Phymastichus coffea TaxID=108790 RepID=UPI00273AF63D|nr:caspase b-like [Phymastichus coffea]
MEYKDREKIDYLCDDLLKDIDITRLWPELLKNKVYNRDDVNIPNWQKNLSNPNTVREICFTIKTRGPHAYRNLIRSLHESSHKMIADLLENYGISNKVFSTNNNGSEVTVEPVNSNELESELSNKVNNHKDFEESNNKILHEYPETLEIKVRKSVEFRCGPEIKDIERYPMQSHPRGLVLIITNTEFEHLTHRPSATKDKENLTKLFEEMGFCVQTFENLTGTDIKTRVKQFSERRDLSKVDSAFIIISSHGHGECGKQETEIQGTDYKMEGYETVICSDIMNYFTAIRCPALQNKPKIFIFQTCRGLAKQKLVPMLRKEIDRETTDASCEDTSKPTAFPSRNYQDTLIAYATIPGYVSYRDGNYGTWFIRILCEVFMNHAYEKHIIDLFIMIDDRLKDQRTSNNECQTLCVINQGFNKHCYINPGL